MWRSVTGERPGGSGGSSSGAGASPAPGPELAAVGLYSQDSPLLGLLSAVSRPAVSFLQRWSPYLPGRALKRDFVERESDFLKQLDDFLPPQQLHSLPWVSLGELGIHGPEEESGLHAETVVSHVLIHPPRGVSKTLLGALWSGAEDRGLTSASAKRASAANGFARRDTGAAADKRLPPKPPHLSPSLVHSLGLRAEISALSPDLDNGYSSLEEELLLAAKAQLQSAGTEARAEDEEAEACAEEQEVEEDIPVLKCDNKAIAFIMGCPCSDDSGDDSGEDDDDDDDDDGFDSVCSSDISDSEDEDEEEEEEEEEFDSEAERLWSALCQNDDPYSPRNFTAKLSSAPNAKLGSSPSAPRPIPRAAADPGQVQSSPGTSVGSSVSSSVGSSAASSSSWDEASETEAELDSLKLLGAFCSSDPYSPLNFQATIRTKPGLDSKPDPKADPRPDRRPGLKPEEERVRKISESSHSSSNRGANTRKQVRFLAEVQVFAVGCEERRGHWEELARDRARFAKRCGEMEEVLRSCLQREHRRRVYLRLAGFCGPSGAAGGEGEERSGL